MGVSLSCIESAVLTWCGAEVGLVNGPGIIVHWGHPHTPLVALDL